MADGECGIGALLKPNRFGILKFADLHPGGAAKQSGEIAEDDRLITVNGVVVKDMLPEKVGPLIRGPPGSKVELEVLSPGSTTIRLVVLTRHPILQSGPAPASPRQSKSIRDTLSDGAQKAAKHLQALHQIAKTEGVGAAVGAAVRQTMNRSKEEEPEEPEIDPKVRDYVNKLQISAPFNYQVSLLPFDSTAATAHAPAVARTIARRQAGSPQPATLRSPEGGGLAYAACMAKM